MEANLKSFKILFYVIICSEQQPKPVWSPLICPVETNIEVALHYIKAESKISYWWFFLEEKEAKCCRGWYTINIIIFYKVIAYFYFKRTLFDKYFYAPNEIEAFTCDLTDLLAYLPADLST